MRIPRRRWTVLVQLFTGDPWYDRKWSPTYRRFFTATGANNARNRLQFTQPIPGTVWYEIAREYPDGYYIFGQHKANMAGKELDLSRLPLL